jgi:hypothetical protein
MHTRTDGAYYARRLGMLAVACLLVLGAATGARAQGCGDPDGNGMVDVIDAANVARAAVGLPSNCTLATCDVDGNGSINVIDAANVARAAVGLPAALNCGGGGGDVNEAVETLLAQLLPAVAGGLGEAGAPQAGACPGGGAITVEFDEDEGDVDIFFEACVIAGLELDGEIFITGNVLDVSLTATELATERAIDIESSLDADLTFAPAGGSVVLNGPVDVAADLIDGEVGVPLVLRFDALRISPAGVLESGSLTLELDPDEVEDTALEGITTIQVTFNGTSIAAVTVTRVGGGTESFVFNIATGKLTPA